MTAESALESQTNLKSSIRDSNQITNQNDPVIQAKDLKKVYLVGKQPVFALNGVSFEIKRGEFCAIVGTSGSGKSTLLNLLAGLEPPSKGNIIINQKSIIGLTENKLVNFRRDHVGFIFQSFNLIPSMSAWENVALPLIFRGTPVAERKKLLLKCWIN